MKKAGAPEDALRTATIKFRYENTYKTDACAPFKYRGLLNPITANQ
jgi:hypothetical protein